MKTTQQQYEEFIEEYEEMKAKYDILVNECNWQDDEIARLKEIISKIPTCSWCDKSY